MNSAFAPPACQAAWLRSRWAPTANRPAVTATSPMVCPSNVPTASRVIGGRSGTLFELIPQLPSRGRSCACGQRRARDNPSRPWTSLVNALVILDLAEGEGVGVDAWVEEGDLEGALADQAGLADELVQAWFGDGAVALVVDVDPVGGARWLPVDPHVEPHGSPLGWRSHDQVQIPGVEAVGDLPLGLVERDGLWLDRPVTSKGPMVEPQPLGDSIDLRGVKDRTVGGREVLGTLVAEVVLRGPQAGPVGGGLHPTGLDRNQVLADAAAAGLAQQLLQDHLGLLVFALAELVVPNLPLGVDEVEGRPVVVVEGAPDRVVVVDRDRVVDPQVRDGSADIVEVVLDVEL